MTKTELIYKLPVSWDQITLNQYINFHKQIKSVIDEGFEDKELMSRVVAIFFYCFTGVNIVDAKLNAPETMKVINRMNQFQADAVNDVEIDESKIKSLDKIDFEPFITFVKYMEYDDMTYYPEMINLLLTDPIENIGDQMNMAEANSFFLRLRERLNQFLTHSQTSLQQKMKLLTVTELLPQIKDI